MPNDYILLRHYLYADDVQFYIFRLYLAPEFIVLVRDSSAARPLGKTSFVLLDSPPSPPRGNATPRLWILRVYPGLVSVTTSLPLAPSPRFSE